MAIIRQTKAVKTLLQIFTESPSAISAPELIRALRDEMNKTTVYRILEKLESGGIIHSFMDKDGLTWYAKCRECAIAHQPDSHPHFQCQACGKIECLQVEVALPILPAYEIESTSILLVGKCRDCVE